MSSAKPWFDSSVPYRQGALKSSGAVFLGDLSVYNDPLPTDELAKPWFDSSVPNPFPQPTDELRKALV